MAYMQWDDQTVNKWLIISDSDSDSDSMEFSEYSVVCYSTV